MGTSQLLEVSCTHEAGTQRFQGICPPEIGVGNSCLLWLSCFWLSCDIIDPMTLICRDLILGPRAEWRPWQKEVSLLSPQFMPLGLAHPPVGLILGGPESRSVLPGLVLGPERS